MRLIVAYALIALVLLAGAVAIALARHHSRDAQYRRRIRHEHRRHLERICADEARDATGG